MGTIPLLAASNAESLPFLERNERGDSMERELLSCNTCLTLIINSVKKKSAIGILTHIIHPSIPLSIFLFIHTSRCWQIVRSFFTVNPQNELSSKVGCVLRFPSCKCQGLDFLSF